MKYMIAYGMNTNVGQMRVRCPEAISLGKVTLPNHKLVFKTHCDIVKSDCDMECALWSITDECERKLDILEGYPNYYSKKYVDVVLDGSSIRAMVYYMNSDDQLCKPNKHYLDMVLDGYADHNMDLTQVFDAVDQANRVNKKNVYYSWN